MEVLLVLFEALISPISQHLFIIKAIQKLYMVRSKRQNIFERPKNIKKLKKQEKNKQFINNLTPRE